MTETSHSPCRLLSTVNTCVYAKTSVLTATFLVHLTGRDFPWRTWSLILDTGDQGWIQAWADRDPTPMTKSRDRSWLREAVCFRHVRGELSLKPFTLGPSFVWQKAFSLRVPTPTGEALSLDPAGDSAPRPRLGWPCELALVRPLPNPCWRQPRCRCTDVNGSCTEVRKLCLDRKSCEKVFVKRH